MPLSCNVENFVLLAALPLIDAIRMSYIYTALPLHYTTMGWALWRLSIILSMTNATRLPINILIVWVGEWAILPLAVLMVVAQIPMLLNPASESFLALGIIVPGMCRLVQGIRGLSFHRHGSDAEQQTHALRWITTSDVFGYAFGAMVGGVLFEHGGFAACAWFQFSACTLELCLVACQPSIYEMFRDWRHPTVTPTAAKPADKADDGAIVTKRCGDFAVETLAQTERQTGLAAAASEATEQNFSTTKHCAGGNLRVAGILAPTIVIFFIEFFNNVTYATEWCIFSLYFKQVYNWSSSWTGAAQMGGDLLAGVMLVLSTLKKNTAAAAATAAAAQTTVEEKGAAHRCWQWSVSLPFTVFWLCLVQAACSFMLAQPELGVAVTGQVLMGTAYVLVVQVNQELAVLYSNGNRRIYRQMMFVTRGALNFACTIVAPVSIYVYEHVSKVACFNAVAAIDAALASVFLAFYARRLAPLGAWTRTYPTLAAAEAELRRRHAEKQGGAARTIENGGGSEEEAVPEIVDGGGDGGGGDAEEDALTCL